MILVNDELKDILIEIKNEQENLKQIIVQNNKILMRRLDKFREFNEILDMRERNLYSEIKKLKN